MANIDNVQLPDGSSYNIVDNTSGFATQNYVDSAVDSVTKTTIGLGNVDNTSDLNKPVSTAQQTAIDNAVAPKVDKTDIAPVESSSTASASHATGSQFYFNGQLVTATADINAGGTITLNGNCTPSDCITKQLMDNRGTNTVKLWENPSSTSALAPQNITLGDLSAYAYLAINSKATKSSVSYADTKLIPVVKDQVTYINWLTFDNTILENYVRSFTITDVTTGITSISTCYKQRQGSAQTIDNNAVIPVTIYGIYK